MITATCSKYKGLRVSFDGGSIKFVDGTAVVSEDQARRLLSLPDSFGVAVEGFALDHEATPDAVEEQPPANNEHVDEGAELFEPKGNASLDEWRAYAIQKGIDEAELEDLKREEVKALLED
ncbi:hypothetical protein ACT3R5_16005 [Glutamicibacter sp. AOP5-A2-7]